MNRIEISKANIIDALMDSPDVRYRAQHAVESHFGLVGIWQCEQYRNGVLIAGAEPETPNVFTTEGVAYMLNIMFGATSKAASKIWYVGLFDNTVTPVIGDTAAAKLGAAGTYGALQTTTDMDEATYPSYNTAVVSAARVVTNAANKAEFTMAATLTIDGAFLGSSSDPTNTAGYLMAAKLFDVARSVIDGDILYTTYAITVS